MLPPALAVAAPGDTIAIRTGSYNLEGGPFNKTDERRASRRSFVLPRWLVPPLTAADARDGRPYLVKAAVQDAEGGVVVYMRAAL